MIQAITDADKAIEIYRYNPDTWASRHAVSAARKISARRARILTGAHPASVRNTSVI